MSHIVTVELQMKNRQAILAACQKFNLTLNEHEETRFYGGVYRTGMSIQLPNWQYPIVINHHTGEVHYDNFGGKWGNQELFDQFAQAYAVEAVKLEAMANGHTVTERVNTDGTISLTVMTGV